PRHRGSCLTFLPARAALIRSLPCRRNLTAPDRRFYLQEIKRDIAYYGRTYRRAHITVDIAGWSPGEASLRIKDLFMRVVFANKRQLGNNPVMHRSECPKL